MSAHDSIRPFWRRVCATMCLVLWVPMVQALEMTITAEYLGGGSGRFDNTTPLSRICGYWIATCKNMPGLDVPITYVKKTTQGTADPRDQFYVRIPGRRTVDVYHEQTGESRQMTFEWSAIHQQVATEGSLSWSHPIYNNTLNGGCSAYRSNAQEKPAVVNYLWRVTDPQAPQPCWSFNRNVSAGRVIDATVNETSLVYNLDIPPPYRLRAGIYRGSVTYTVGPGGDFDFGNDVSQLSANSLTVNFELDVRHAFLFEFPPGSDRAVLEPKGGWDAWMAGGKAPSKLYRDLPFRLWSTGPFKVYKICGNYSDVSCGIVNGNRHVTPVEVALSLPGGIQHQGSPVEHLPLPTGRAAALQFDSLTPTLNRPGQLHFYVGEEYVRGMLAYPGSTYTGQVTVVFDAEL